MMVLDDILISTADKARVVRLDTIKSADRDMIAKQDCEASWKHNVCAADWSREGWGQEFAISDIEQWDWNEFN